VWAAGGECRAPETERMRRGSRGQARTAQAQRSEEEGREREREGGREGRKVERFVGTPSYFWASVPCECECLGPWWCVCVCVCARSGVNARPR